MLGSVYTFVCLHACITWHRHGKLKFLMTDFFPISWMYEFSCDRKVKGQDMQVFFNSILSTGQKEKV
jgi:hypothetical protein